MKMVLSCILLSMILLGCANPFRNFYNDRTGGINILENPNVIISAEDPKLYRGNNREDDAQRMLEDGYELLGYSSLWWTGRNQPDEKQAISYGKEIHASVILYYCQYAGTKSGTTPLILPDNKTTVTQGTGTAQSSGNIYAPRGNVRYSGSTNYSGQSTSTTYGTQIVNIPYSVDRYDYFASYWIKRKPPILGVLYNDLTPEIRKEIGSNKGVIINVVGKGSPAFSADLLKGDIIKKINDIEIIDVQSLSDFLGKHAGEKIDVLLIRDGKELTKIVQLNKESK